MRLQKCHRRDLYPFRASGFEDHCRPDDSTVAQGSGTVLCRSSGAAILWRAGRFYDFGASDGSGAGRRRCDCQKSPVDGRNGSEKKRLRAPFARILRTISMRTPSTARTVRKMRRLKLPFSLQHGTPRALSTCLARSFASTRMTTTAEITNLLDLDARGLTEYCACLGEAAFRARQLQRWIHQAGAVDFDGMTDLAKAFREKLKA